MWKSLLPYGIAIMFALGWLKTHDHYVKAQALADARRDSIEVAAKRTDIVLAELDKVTSVLSEREDSLTELVTLLHHKRDTLYVVRGQDEAELAKWKDEVMQKAHVDAVDSLVNKYDNLVLTLKAQVTVAEAVAQAEADRKITADSLTIVQIFKVNALRDINDKLRKELKTDRGPSNVKVVTQYILPALTIGGIIGWFAHGN